jgi:hypothetical protein
MFIVEQSIMLKDAEATKATLLDALDHHEADGFSFDLSGAEPSQISLQICLAAIKEMKARSIVPVPGEVLELVLAQDIAQRKAE